MVQFGVNCIINNHKGVQMKFSIVALICGLACLHGQTTQKPKWVLLSEREMERQDSDIQKATFRDGQTYQLVSKKPMYICTVSLSQDASGLRLSVLSTLRKKKIMVERDFISLSGMRRMPADTTTINPKYGPNGELLRDDNPPKSGFENKCGGFIDTLPTEIRKEVLFALK